MFASSVSTMEEEQKKLTTLRLINPVLASNLMRNYTEMVTAATEGKVHDILKLVQTSQGPPPIWFKVKMFRESVLNLRLGVMKFMVEQGFEVESIFEPLKDLLFVLIERNKKDSDRSLERDKLYAQVMMFLVVKCRMNVHHFRKGDKNRLTPIHIAAREGLVYMCLLLGKVGADVNSVGMGDEMPLTLAIDAKHDACVKVLLKMGAKQTWRKDVKQITPW